MGSGPSWLQTDLVHGPLYHGADSDMSNVTKQKGQSLSGVARRAPAPLARSPPHVVYFFGASTPMTSL